MDIYAAAGVDYDVLDAGKRRALAAALSTNQLLQGRGAYGIDASRGEPAYVFQLDDRYLAMVLECLGTKSLIARQIQDQTGANYFANIGYDSVAAIVNDIICVGALPLVVNAYFATGSSQWYSAYGRFEALVDGWRQACEDAGATWGGGESPGLSGVVVDTEIDLAGSATGAVPSGVEPILGQQLEDGDAIVLVASNGMHANGASLIRKTAGELTDGYQTKLPSGVNLGDSVLERSAMYVSLVDQLLNDGVPLSYLSHITGHGFRKIMRANPSFTYRITEVPPVPELFAFLADHAGMSPAETYGTFNMGAGFAIYCPESSVTAVLAAADKHGHDAWQAGVVEDGERSVIVEPIGVTYSDADLQLR